jgi:hypothetical protein
LRRRLLLALMLVVGVLVFPSSASATHDLLDPPPNDPTKDFAVGGFQASGEQKIGFSAQSDGPKAEDAWGHFSDTLVEVGLTGRWRVVCLAVLGSKASLGLVPQNTAASEIFITEVFVVRDSGLPGGMGDTYIFRPGADPENCQTGLLTEPTFPIERGNILVHDAQLP